MSFFPRSFTSEFSPLFRLMDDYERVARSALNGASSSGLHNFSPKFDVREVKDAYELHGELPGIEQQNINIEWSDGNTLTISGRSEHRFERGTPPKTQEAQAVIEDGESSTPATQDTASENYQKPTVEDEAGEGQSTSSDSAAVTKATPTTEQQAVTNATATPSSKYWITERSVGQFHRAFSFPARVNQEAVSASLKNGILSIVVPKAKRPEPRKIEVNIE